MTPSNCHRYAVLFFCLMTAFATPAQVVKKCSNTVTMRLSSVITTQGALLLADVTSTKPLPEIHAQWARNDIPLWNYGTAGNHRGLIGVDLEKAPGKYDWQISWNSNGTESTCTLVVTVRPGKFPTEHLKVEKQFVEPDPEQQKRAEEDQKKMRAIYATLTPEKLWSGKFQMPLDGATTGNNFGRRRVLNGQARSPHAGVDFPAPTGTPVYAAQAGKVLLAENLYYSGNTVVIDHGYGIFTLYAHLSEILVKPGDLLQPHQELGKVGATGRVTGPHLHWGLTVDHARVNAIEIVRRLPN